MLNLKSQIEKLIIFCLILKNWNFQLSNAAKHSSNEEIGELSGAASALLIAAVRLGTDPEISVSQAAQNFLLHVSAKFPDAVFKNEGVKSEFSQQLKASEIIKMRLFEVY